MKLKEIKRLAELNNLVVRCHRGWYQVHTNCGYDQPGYMNQYFGSLNALSTQFAALNEAYRYCKTDWKQ